MSRPAAWLACAETSGITVSVLGAIAQAWSQPGAV